MSLYSLLVPRPSGQVSHGAEMRHMRQPGVRNDKFSVLSPFVCILSNSQHQQPPASSSRGLDLNCFHAAVSVYSEHEYRTHQSTQPACYRFAQEIFCLTLNRQGAVKESKKKYGGERGGTPLALLGGSVVEVRSPKMLPKH